MHPEVAEKVSRALMPHMMAVQTSLNSLTAAVEVAMSEDGSYDRGPELRKSLKTLQERVQKWPSVVESAVSFNGLTALDQGAEFQPVLEAIEPIVTELERMRDAAGDRVSTSAEMAANEAIGRIIEFMPLMHPTTITEVLKPAFGANA